MKKKIIIIIKNNEKNDDEKVNENIENNDSIKNLNQNQNLDSNKLKKIVHEVNIKNKYKIINYNNKTSIKKQEIKKFLDRHNMKNMKSKIFTGLNNKDINNKANQKNNFSLSERIIISNISNINSDENNKILNEMSKIGSKKNSKIYYPPKTTVKSLTRVQSALISKSKFPYIVNHYQSSQNITKMTNILSKTNNNRHDSTSIEEDKLSNSLKNNSNKNTNNKDVYHVSEDKKYKTFKLKCNVSPNVRILQQHGIDQFYENDNNFNHRNSEADNFKGMISNLQKYISGYNSPYANQKELRYENRKMQRNSDYFKLKELINGNNNIKSQKNKTNIIQLGFNNFK